MQEQQLNDLTKLMDLFKNSMKFFPTIGRKPRSFDLFKKAGLEPNQVRNALEKWFAGIDIGRPYTDDCKPTRKDGLVLRIFLNGFDDKEDLQDFERFKASCLDQTLEGFNPMKNSKVYRSIKETGGYAAGKQRKEPLMSIIEQTVEKLVKLAKENEVPVDLIENFQILGMDAKAQSVSPGDGIRRSYGSLGTATGIFFEDGSGDPMLMSCWHVLSDRAPEGPASVWKSTSKGGDPIAIIDLPAPEPDHLGDVAVAKILDWENQPIEYECNIPHEPHAHQKTFPITKSRCLTPKDVGKSICVTSRVLDGTCGIIDGIGTYSVDLRGELGIVAIDGFRIVPEKLGEDIELSKPGDSGMMRFIQEDGEAVGVGVHFAAEPSGKEGYREYALASHLPNALKKLGVSLTQEQALASPAKEPAKKPPKEPPPQPSPLATPRRRRR